MKECHLLIEVCFQMFVHNQDMEALYKYVPKNIMPAEYGGNGGTLSEITGKTAYYICVLQVRIATEKIHFWEKINKPESYFNKMKKNK